MTQEERRAATRTDLLEAAARVFARRGFHGASVDDVAADAGYTSGAVYHNFGSKEDLFLAAFEHQVARRVREVQEAHSSAAGGSASERTEAIAARWMEFVRSEPDMFLMLVEYWAYAVRDPKLRKEFAERFGAFRDATARIIEGEARRGGWELPESPADLALGINALTYGIALQYMADPDEVPDDLLGKIAVFVFEGIRVRSPEPEADGDT